MKVILPVCEQGEPMATLLMSTADQAFVGDEQTKGPKLAFGVLAEASVPPQAAPIMNAAPLVGVRIETDPLVGVRMEASPTA